MVTDVIKVVLKTICIKNVKFKIIKITGCQYMGYFNYSETKLGRTKLLTGPHAAHGPRVGHSCLNVVKLTENIDLNW